MERITKQLYGLASANMGFLSKYRLITRVYFMIITPNPLSRLASICGLFHWASSYASAVSIGQPTRPMSNEAIKRCTNKHLLEKPSRTGSISITMSRIEERLSMIGCLAIVFKGKAQSRPFLMRSSVQGLILPRQKLR